MKRLRSQPWMAASATRAVGKLARTSARKLGRPLAAALLALMTLGPCATHAQDIGFASDRAGQSGELETDRDAFTPAMTTVGYHTLVVESSYSFSEGGPEGETNSYPELLTRYGINDWLELRLGWNFETSDDVSLGGISAPPPNQEGPVGGRPQQRGSEEGSHIFYGFKAQITEQDDWRPRSIFIAQGFTPTSGEESTTHFVGTYGFGWELNDRIRWDSAIRFANESESDDRFNEWAPSTVLRVPIGEYWSAHIEYFAIVTDGRDDERTQAFISPGMHCLLTENLELGVRIGWGTTADSPNFFVNTGIGARF